MSFLPLILPKIIVLLAATGIKGFIARAVFSVFLSLVASKLFGPRTPRGVGLTSTQITVRTALSYRSIVYGRAMVSGPIVYANLAGTDREDLYYDIALADHLCEAVVSVWLDGSEIPVADINWTAGSGGSDGTGTRLVAGGSSTRWRGAGAVDALFLSWSLGYDAQPVSGALDSAFADITSAYRLRGICHLIFQARYIEGTEHVWRQGLPRNIKAVLDGRLLYDPRLDSTQSFGSGSHRHTDATTWAWSENPALAVADYLFNILGADAAIGIDWQSIATAADDCEVSVAIPSSTEDRFTCNGVLSMGSTHKDNLDSLLSSMDGNLNYVGGKWIVRASVWVSSSQSIVADDLAGDIQVQGSASKGNRYNLIRGFFVDPAREYKAVEFPHVTASEFLTRDNGERLEFDLQLPMTNTGTMAQRIAYRLLERGDQQVIADFPLNPTGVKMKCGGVFDATIAELSWSSKTFRSIAWAHQPDGSVMVTGREEIASNLADPLEGEYSTLLGLNITAPSLVVAPPTALTATSIASGIRVEWTNPPSRLFEFIDIYASATNAWSGATLIASTRSTLIDFTYDSGTERWFWARARGFSDQESLRVPDSDTSAITATSGSGADGTPGQSDFVGAVYIRSSGAPSQPSADDGQYNFATNTLTAPSGWSTTPPAGSDPLYISLGTFTVTAPTTVDGTVTWTTPALFVQDGATGSQGDTGDTGSTGSAGSDGASSHGVLVNGGFETGDLTGWAATPGSVINDGTARTGTYYLRIASGAGGPNHISDKYSAPAVGREIRVTGFARRDASDLPTNNGSIGVRWFDNAAAQIGGRINVSSADFTVSGWQALEGAAVVPETAETFVFDCGESSGSGAWEFDDLSAIVEGATGTDPIVSALTNPSVVVTADSDGTNYSLTGTGGTHTVAEGTTDQTASATHSVLSPATVDGLTMSVNASGVYSLAGGSWSGDEASFTLRAVYGGVTNDKVYTIAKSLAGAGAPGVVQLPVSFNAEAIGTLPQTATISFETDGAISATGATGLQWFSTITTDVGDDYEVRVESLLAGSWDVEAAAVGTWVVMTEARQWRMIRTVMEGAGSDNVSCVFEIRLTSEQSVLADTIGTAEAADA